MNIIEDTLDIFYGDVGDYRPKQIGEFTKLPKKIFKKYIVPLAHLYLVSGIYSEHEIIPKIKIGYTIIPNRVYISLFTDDIPIKATWLYNHDDNIEEKLYLQFSEFYRFVGGK